VVAVVIPPFNQHGVLPPGRYPASADEVESRFVLTFPTSLTRKDIFDGWKRRQEELLELVPIHQEWIDGSFVTSKRDAGDLDVVVFLDGPTVDALPLNDRKRVSALTMGAEPVLRFGCHSFLVPLWPEGHPLHQHYLQASGYWDRLWSRDRRAPEKGYLDVRSA
jgi:hypothetical protein